VPCKSIALFSHRIHLINAVVGGRECCGIWVDSVPAPEPAQGIATTSADGSEWHISVNNDGTIKTEKIS
jgi:hypothetical protein